jgi:acyl-CoA synthetase (AMP-forming)/AMP-acid ligase II
MSADQPSWNAEIVTTTFGGVPFRMYQDRPHYIGQLLPFASHWPDRAAIIQGDRIVTFQGLVNGSATKATRLMKAGVRAGDRIFLTGWNGPDWILNYWACIRIGAVPVLGNAWWSDAEVADAFELIQPTAILADRQGGSKMPSKAQWDESLWRCDENALLEEGEAPVAAVRAENGPAAIIFTSGTSGRPKAVELAHRSLLSNQMMILHVTRKLPYVPDPAAGDVGLHTGPLFHIGGLHAMHRSVLVGNTLVFGKGRFDPGEALELIERYRIVRWSAVPTMATRLVEHPDLAARDISSLKAITLGGSAVTADFLDRVRIHLPSVSARITTGYGLSENGGQATTASGRDTSGKPGSTGRAMPLTEIRTVPLPDLPDGEILIRSPTQMLRYFGNPDTPIDAEGWIHTGDLGRIDENGDIWITGRSKEIIIRGGENIAPAAVEEALISLPGVSEAKVFGLPHPEFGEEVMAAVVVESGITADDLAASLRSRLASFSIPTRWWLQTDALPTNQTGKIDKAAILELISADAAA